MTVYIFGLARVLHPISSQPILLPSPLLLLLLLLLLRLLIPLDDRVVEDVTFIAAGAIIIMTGLQLRVEGGGCSISDRMLAF